MPTEKFKANEVIDALEKARGIKAHAARLLECDRKTVDNYIKRHPTVERAYKNLRATLIDLAEYQLLGMLDRGEWPAVKFVLATLGRDRGYVPGQDITSGDQPLAGGYCIIEVPVDPEDEAHPERNDGDDGPPAL